MRPSIFRFLALAALIVISAVTMQLPGRGQSAAAATAAPSPATSGAPEADDTYDTPPPIPSPQPAVEDAKVHKLAVQQFLAWQTATIDRDLYSDTVNAQLTDDMLDRATKTLANMGALQSATFLGISKAKSANLYVYKMTCTNGSVNMDFSVEPTGKIGLIFFV